MFKNTNEFDKKYTLKKILNFDNKLRFKVTHEQKRIENGVFQGNIIGPYLFSGPASFPEKLRKSQITNCTFNRFLDPFSA